MTANVYTYNGLVNEIITWTNRNDATFINNVPVFISLAEQEIFTKLSTLGNEIYITGNFNINNSYIVKPALWGKTARFSFTDQNDNITVLERVSVSYQYFYNPSQVTPSTIGNPRYYSDKATQYFYVSPAPTQSFQFEIGYFEKVPPLTITNQTNANSLYRFDMLLWACLQKSFAFVNATETSQLYGGLFQAAIDTYNTYDKDRLADATTSVEME